MILYDARWRRLLYQDSIRADQASYLNEHPEIATLLDGFIRAVVEKKPSDVFEFARHHFAAGDEGERW